MSLTEKNSHNNDDNQSVHISNPARIFWLAILILVVVGGVMYYIDINTNDLRTGKSRTTVNSAEGVSSRIQPVAKFALQVVEKDAPLKTGKEVYEATCATCHATGLAGAPTFGDKAAWAPYIATGYEEMLNVALHGKGAMPAKGGNSTLKDIEVERAMVYMANEGGAGFDEPSEDGEKAEAPAVAKTDAPKKEAVTDKPEVKETAVTANDTAEAEKPAADASEAAAIPAATEEQLTTGKGIYDAACFVCHGTGVAGAPKIGNKEDWAPYMATGLDTMLQIAISGKGAMPPRGTAMSASDDDLRAAILYMIEDAR